MSADVEHQPRDHAVNCRICAHRETWSHDAVCSYCRSEGVVTNDDTAWAAEQVRLRNAMFDAARAEDAAKCAYDEAGEVWRHAAIRRAAAEDAFRQHGRSL